MSGERGAGGEPKIRGPLLTRVRDKCLGRERERIKACTNISSLGANNKSSDNLWATEMVNKVAQSSPPVLQLQDRVLNPLHSTLANKLSTFQTSITSPISSFQNIVIQIDSIHIRQRVCLTSRDGLINANRTTPYGNVFNDKRRLLSGILEINPFLLNPHLTIMNLSTPS